MSITVPKELKSFINSIERNTTVSGNISYHSTYTPNPAIRIVTWITGWRKKPDDDGNRGFSMGSLSFVYYLNKKKWEEEK